MSATADRLYQLLPLIYRQRDEEQSGVLRELLAVIAEQVDVVEDDISQLYDNWFIETCQDWAVPYLGDLIGYQAVHSAGEPRHARADAAADQARNRVVIPRRQVANTIRYRRRKGTLALLEQLAADAAGWPGRAVEFHTRLALTQHLRHQRSERGRLTNLKQGARLAAISGPFSEPAHSVDVRVASSEVSAGRYNIPSVGLFVWRLRSYPVTHSPACCIDKLSHCYTFSILGNDVPLHIAPQAESDPAHIAEELQLPAPIRRDAFARNPEHYYGEGRSLAIWVGVKDKTTVVPHLLPLSAVVPADLSGWRYTPDHEGQVLVDPQLGRIAFPLGHRPSGVWVSYRYAFSADMGGGEYPRPILEPAIASADDDMRLEKTAFFRVSVTGEIDSISAAVEQWRNVRADKPYAVIEIVDSGVYSEQLVITLERGESLTIRAANRTRPTIYLQDRQKNLPDSLTVRSDTGGHVVLDGLLIVGRPVHIEGKIESATIRHCTLVPGWSIDEASLPELPSEPSLELYATNAAVRIEHTILGSIQVYHDEVMENPIPVVISDSIIDANSDPADSDQAEAIGAPHWPFAHVILTLRRVTVFGKIQVHAIELAENSLFMAHVDVQRRQIGCMRFCYAPPGSRTPKRFHCQPDLATTALGSTATPSLVIDEQLRVRPQFVATYYGKPAYAQLAPTCAKEISMGADDESEMGVFHDLFQAQRAANLRARLNEFMPAGMDAGIIFQS